jgi:hypothetical protein
MLFLLAHFPSLVVKSTEHVLLPKFNRFKDPYEEEEVDDEDKEVGAGGVR